MPTDAAPDFTALVREQLQHSEIPLFGFVDIEMAVQDPEQLFAYHVARNDQWIASQSHADMQYLARGQERRRDPRHLLPTARSVLSVAVPYDRAEPDDRGPKYARYLSDSDYHERIKKTLTGVFETANQIWVGRGHAPIEFKVCVDTSAILERTWAYLAGLGWIGKNTLLIHPRLGSYLFLGEVLYSEACGIGPQPMRSLCGNCSACIQGCPTQALDASRGLDSNRCISYLTLEKRGLASFDPHGWIAGCDTCQEVCPFNLKPARGALPLERTHLMTDLIQLLRESPDEYRIRVRDSSLSRVKPENFERNLALWIQGAVGTHANQPWPAIHALILERIERFGASQQLWAEGLARIEAMFTETRVGDSI